MFKDLKKFFFFSIYEGEKVKFRVGREVSVIFEKGFGSLYCMRFVVWVVDYSSFDLWLK